MIGLMSDAFRDPYYLRYKYQPDCSLHDLAPDSQDHKSTESGAEPPEHHKGKKDDSRHHSLKGEPAGASFQTVMVASTSGQGSSQLTATVGSIQFITMALLCALLSLGWK